MAHGLICLSQLMLDPTAPAIRLNVADNFGYLQTNLISLRDIPVTDVRYDQKLQKFVILVQKTEYNLEHLPYHISKHFQVPSIPCNCVNMDEVPCHILQTALDTNNNSQWIGILESFRAGNHIPQFDLLIQDVEKHFHKICTQMIYSMGALWKLSESESYAQESIVFTVEKNLFDQKLNERIRARIRPARNALARDVRRGLKNKGESAYDAGFRQFLPVAPTGFELEETIRLVRKIILDFRKIIHILRMQFPPNHQVVIKQWQHGASMQTLEKRSDLKLGAIRGIIDEFKNRIIPFAYLIEIIRELAMEIHRNSPMRLNTLRLGHAKRLLKIG